MLIFKQLFTLYFQEIKYNNIGINQEGMFKYNSDYIDRINLKIDLLLILNYLGLAKYEIISRLFLIISIMDNHNINLILWSEIK